MCENENDGVLDCRHLMWSVGGLSISALLLGEDVDGVAILQVRDGHDDVIRSQPTSFVATER